jgi:1,4-alpha-glucan branching enzyme
LLFMGEESASRTPFLFFTDHSAELADAVREGRRNEFSRFQEFADPARRERIPDPNALQTFAASKPQADPSLGPAREALYRRLTALRAAEIVPRLDGTHALTAEAIGPKAVVARWRLGDGAVLTVAINLDAQAVTLDPPAGVLLFASSEMQQGWLPGPCTCAYLDLARSANV